MSLTSPVRVAVRTNVGNGDEILHSSAIPMRTNNSSHSGNDATHALADLPAPPPPRCSLEFAFTVVPLLCVIVYGTRSSIRASYLAYNDYQYILEKPDKYLHKLTFGFVRGYDSGGDAQWRSYAHFTPLFVVLFGLVGFGSRVMHRFRRRERIAHVLSQLDEDGKTRVSSRSAPSTSPHGLGRVLGRWWSLPLFHAIVGIIFAAILHGPHFVFSVVVVLVNYALFKLLHRRVPYWVFASIMWFLHVSFLYIVEACEGFEKTYWVQYFLPSSVDVARTVLPESLAARAVPLWPTHMRWQQVARMATLRMIAFNYDLWESTHAQHAARQRAVQKHRETCLECAQLRRAHGAPRPGADAYVEDVTSEVSPNTTKSTASMTASSSISGNTRSDDRFHSGDGVEITWDESLSCYKFRTEYARDLGDYNLLNYLAFSFFAPLYLAGPMMSFNAFVSYLKQPTKAMPARAMSRYIVNILVVFLLGYTQLHFMYVQTMTVDLARFKTLAIDAQALLLFWYLSFLWVKFAFLWRTSRLYAVWSGVQPPEDMRRCFADTLTIQDFWRDWHASFNLWIVRYMYIPMGGRARILCSLWPIFFFIAIWHDQRLHLFEWAALIVVSFITELASRMLAERYLVKPVRRAMAMLVNTNTAHSASSLSSSEHAQPAPRWARRVARLALSWRPYKRQMVWRVLRGMASAYTILSLIVINLIGFLVQSQRAKSAVRASRYDRQSPDGKQSETDHTVAEILFTAEHALFVVCVVLVMVDVGIHNTFYRDRNSYREALERRALEAAGQLGK